METDIQEFNYSFRDLVMSIPPPLSGCTVGVSKVLGKCPFGFMEEDTWDVDENGQLNYPMCPFAVEALEPVFEKLPNGEDSDSARECAAGDCRLTFVVHSRSRAASGDVPPSQ